MIEDIPTPQCPACLGKGIVSQWFGGESDGGQSACLIETECPDCGGSELMQIANTIPWARG